ncbi:hypothetical protein WJX77_006634 [Trebouxia sp. C0004]
MVAQPAVVPAQPDDDGIFCCPEAGCSISFADRHKQNFKGFRKYHLAYYHYWQEAFNRESPNSPEQHNETEEAKAHCQTRQLSSSSCLEQADLTVISSADAADKDCSVEVLGLISAEELQNAVRDDGPYALIAGQGKAACINTDIINKVKREGGRSLHTDRTASNNFLQDVYKRFNNRVAVDGHVHVLGGTCRACNYTVDAVQLVFNCSGDSGPSFEDNGDPERETGYGTDHPDESTVYSSDSCALTTSTNTHRVEPVRQMRERH